MDFDLSKENIQPLRGGRNATQLGTALQAQNDTEYQKELLQQKEEFENTIKNYKGADPLENWYNYISWIEQSYPKHGHEGNLTSLLEDCLGKFEHDTRYLQDRRLCKLFIKYIDFQHNPLELFQLLYSRGFGTDCTDLYRAWAYYYEASGDFKRADHIFQLGFQANAQPQEELKSAYDNFTMAVGRHVLRGSADTNHLAEKRRALTSLRTYKHKHRTVVPSQRTGVNVVDYLPGTVKSTAEPSRSNNFRVDIFQDSGEEAIAGPSQSTSSAKPKSILDSASKRETVHKENMLKAGPWNNVLQKKSGVHSTNINFTVHEDDTEQEHQKQDSHNNSTPTPPYIQQQQPPPPVVNCFADLDVELFVPEPNNNTKISQYNIEEVYASNTEFSFEELNAKKYIECKKSMEQLYPNYMATSYENNYQQTASAAGDHQTQSTYTTPLKLRLSVLKVSSPIVDPSSSEQQQNGMDGGRRKSIPTNLIDAFNSPAPNSDMHKHNNLPQNTPEEVAKAVESISSTKLWNNSQESHVPHMNVPIRNDSITTHTKEAMYEVNNLWADSNQYPYQEYPKQSFQIHEDVDEQNYLIPQQNEQPFAIYSDSYDYQPPQQHQLQPNQHQLHPNQHQMPHHQLQPNQHQIHANQHHLTNSSHQMPPQSSHQMHLQSPHQMPPQSPHQMPPQSPHQMPPQSPHQMPPQSPHQMPPQSPHQMPPQSPHQMPPQSPHQMPPQTPHQMPPQSPHQMHPQSPHQMPPPNSHHMPPPSPHQMHPHHHQTHQQMVSHNPHQMHPQMQHQMPHHQMQQSPIHYNNQMSQHYNNHYQHQNATPGRLGGNFDDTMSTQMFNVNLPYSNVSTPYNDRKMQPHQLYQQQYAAPAAAQQVQQPPSHYNVHSKVATPEHNYQNMSPMHYTPAAVAATSANHSVARQELFPPTYSKGNVTPIPQSNLPASGSYQNYMSNQQQQQQYNMTAEHKHEESVEKTNNKLSIILENSKEYRSCSSGGTSSSGSSALTLKSTLAMSNRESLPAIKEMSHVGASRDTCGMEYEVGEAMLQLSQEIYLNDEKADEPDYVTNNNPNNYLRGSDIYVDQNSKHSTDSYNSPQKEESQEGESMEWDEHSNSMDYTIGCQNLSAILASEKPVNPFDSKVIDCLLKKARFPNTRHAGYIKVQQIPKISPKETIFLKNDKYLIDKMLGKGTFGTVLKANNLTDGGIVAIKYQKPSNFWEFYISKEIQHRIKDSMLLLSFMDISKSYYCKTSSLFVSEFSKYGSLLNVANKVKKVTGQKSLKDVVTYHFVVEMIRIVAALHQCQIIHADIKPDNFLVMCLPPDGGRLSLQLIDFGCSIDMTLFPSDMCFYQVVTTEDFTCTEMREGKPWTYQTDLFCMAATAHVLLMGEYMKLKKEDGVWTVMKRFPRYVNLEIWRPFFRQLLNIESCDNLPDLTQMQAHFQSILNERHGDLTYELRQIANIMNDR